VFEGNRGGAFMLGARLLRIASVGAAVGKGPRQVSGSELLPIWSTDCCGAERRSWAQRAGGGRVMIPFETAGFGVSRIRRILRRVLELLVLPA
jgi:hypothetical protein